MEGRVLGAAEAIGVATVLEDCVDQLHIIGDIIPVSLESPNARQTELSARLREAEENSNKLFGKPAKVVHPRCAENLRKIYYDRGFVERVLQDTMSELASDRSFEALVDTVKTEKQRKASHRNTILQEERGRKYRRQLVRTINNVKNETEKELTTRNEMISHLKDQLQEFRAKCDMEYRYIKKWTDTEVAISTKQRAAAEKKLKEDLANLNYNLDDENRAHAEVESYLIAHTKELAQKQDYWAEKFHEDKAEKQSMLDAIKIARAKDLEVLGALRKKYKEYQQVVVLDRTQKERDRRLQEQEAKELKSCIKIQSFWRGVQVRKGFGPFKKKKKDKKGKKGKGKKKR